MKFSIVKIEHTDGTKSEETATRTLVTEGTLFLWYQSDSGIEEQHMGAYPLANIKKWSVKES